MRDPDVVPRRGGGRRGRRPQPRTQVASNAAVLLFGGIETTEAMIASAFAAPARRRRRDGPRHERTRRCSDAAIEESLRLEPAAAVIDRYATRDIELGGVADPCRRPSSPLSLAGANRDPAVFPDPDRFDIGRRNLNLQVAFAHGPARLPRAAPHAARGATALRRSLERLPGLRLDPTRRSVTRGLVFRKPAGVSVLWDREAADLRARRAPARPRR